MPRTDQLDETPEDEIIVSGPGLNEPQDEENEPADELVEVKLNGKTLRVSPDVAEALREREDQTQRRISEQGRELGELRQRVNSIAQPTRPAEPTEDPDLDYFRNPSKVIEERLKAEREAVRAEYQAERARETFWTTFYGEHPELKGKEEVVEAILQRRWNSLKDGTRQDLAQAVHSVLGTSEVAPTTRKTLENKPSVTERPGQPARKARPEPEDDTPGTLSGVLQARRAARRAAATRQAPARTQGTR